MGRHKIVRPPEVTFHMTQGRRWLGNGMGTEPAHWEARLNGKVVGTWHPDGGGTFRTVEAMIFGVHESFIHKHAEWKTRVRQEFARRVEENYRLRDDVCEIRESRPWHKDREYWEEWHSFEVDGVKTGHMIGMYRHTGKIIKDLAAMVALYDDHKLTCSYYTKYRKW